MHPIRSIDGQGGGHRPIHDPANFKGQVRTALLASALAWIIPVQAEAVDIAASDAGADGPWQS